MKRAALWALLAALCCAAPEKVRKPGVAGAFYPGDAAELGAMVDGYLAQARPPAVGMPIALAAPHAGYPYSGPVAGYAYALLKGRRPERVVVIAPSHYEAFDFAAVYDGAAYETPLGRVPVDTAFAAKLGASGGLVRLSSRGHGAGGERSEHSLEVQLPFLQRTLGAFRLVPVVMGSQSYEASRALGAALAKLAQGSDTLIVASSDLSHYHGYDDATKLDRKTLRAIEEYDYLSLTRNCERRVWEACGCGPIATAMIAAQRLGANRATVLKYANSGDTSGDRSRVVGYGAVAFWKGPATAAGFSLTDEERRELLSLARRSVETAVRQHKLYEYKVAGSDALVQERGAFVTLKIKGALRGCIGYIAPTKPLPLTVRDVAAYAAVEDRRFPPVTVEELPKLEYEISVLSPLRRVMNVKEIEPGRDGLVIRKNGQEGLLLPQVATEQKWDRMEFVRQTCVKAGLPPAAWKDPDADIFAFTALVFR